MRSPAAQAPCRAKCYHGAQTHAYQQRVLVRSNVSIPYLAKQALTASFAHEENFEQGTRINDPVHGVAGMLVSQACMLCLVLCVMQSHCAVCS